MVGYIVYLLSLCEPVFIVLPIETNFLFQVAIVLLQIVQSLITVTMYLESSTIHQRHQRFAFRALTVTGPTLLLESFKRFISQ